MVRKIVWTKNAYEELKHILSYWEEKTGTKKYSIRLNNKIRIILNYIKENNYIGYQTNIKDVRLMICSHYKIFYKIQQETIFIISVFDSRRNPNDIKL